MNYSYSLESFNPSLLLSSWILWLLYSPTRGQNNSLDGVGLGGNVSLTWTETI